MYLEYWEYGEMGGALTEQEFERLELRARLCIDRLTRCRLQGEKPVRDAVKRLTYALIAAMHEDDGHMGRPVESLSNDGVNVRYAPVPPETRYAQLARLYLAGERCAGGVGVMYAGVDA